MSTDPRDSDSRGSGDPELSGGRADGSVNGSGDGHGAAHTHGPSDGPGATTPRSDLPPDRSPAALRPRHGSGLVARILTAVYALVVTPIATGLLAYGGSALGNYAMSRGYIDASLAQLLSGPVGARVIIGVGLGILLLASVVATGVFSSAGLLAVGGLGLISVATSAVPGLAFQIYQQLSPTVPTEVLQGISFGLPLVLHPLLGGLGLALVIARRRPAPHLVSSLLGLLLLPAGLAIAALMLFQGHAAGLNVALMTFSTHIHPLNAILVVLGGLLLYLAAAASRWSPYALVIPAIVLLLASVGSLLSTVDLIPPAVWNSQAGQAAMTFLFVGGGFAAAAVMLVHTAVLAIVRARSRRRLRVTAGTAA